MTYRVPRKRRVRSHRATRFRVLAFTLLIFLIIIYAVADSQLKPYVRSFTVTQVKTLATQHINDSVNQVLTAQPELADGLVTIQQDKDNVVKSVQSNASKVNRLKAAVTNSILDRINKERSKDLKIPLGSLIGCEYLSGRGPCIPIRVTLSGTVTSNLKTQFKYVGVNHLNHEVYMSIHAEIFAGTFGTSSVVNVDTTFLISETVILGEVPETYTMVDDDKSDVIGKIFDYRNVG